MTWARAALALLLVACHAPGARAPAGPSPEDGVVQAIERGDLGLAMRAVCAAYARTGLRCADTLALGLLEPDDVMSHIGQEHDVSMQPAPADGWAYWDNWSRVLSGGTWQPRPLFADELEARRIANMMLVTVLAHELGHHLAQRYGCNPGDRTARELRADELSLPVVRELVRDPRLGPLHARMRQIADAMIAVTGVAEPAPGEPLPRVPGHYAGVHLARQRRLLAGAIPDVAHDVCLPAATARLALRQLSASARKANVATVRTLPRSLATLAIDRAGTVYTLDMFGEGEGQRDFALRVLGSSAPPRTITLPRDSSGAVNRFAAFAADRFVVDDGTAVYLVEGPVLAARQVAEETTEGLAFDERGVVVVAHSDETTWTAGPPGGAARWSVPLETTAGDTPGHGRPGPFTVAGERVVFFDVWRNTLRSAGASGVLTLAGGLAGRRDGAAEAAELFGVEAISVAGDGAVWWVEGAKADLAVRTLKR